MNRKEGAGFLGCVRLPPAVIIRLKDTGCEGGREEGGAGVLGCVRLGREGGFLRCGHRIHQADVRGGGGEGCGWREGRGRD